MDKNPPASGGDMVDAWSGKIPHAAEQLSQYTVTPETACATTGACAPRAYAPQQEKPPR